MRIEVVRMIAHEDFGGIRIVVIDGEPWFVTNDVCRALKFKDYNSVITRYVNKDNKRIIQKPRDRYFNSRVAVNTAGLKSLGLASELSGANWFVQWLLYSEKAYDV